MSFLGVMLFCAFCVLVNRYLYKKWLSFPAVLTVIWCVSLAFSTLGLFETTPVSLTTILYALMFVAAINVFSYIFYLVFPVKAKEKKTKKEKIEIDNTVLTIVLAVCLCALIVVLYKSIGVFLSERDFAAIRNAFIGYDSISPHMQVLVSITLVPIGKAATIFAMIDYVYNKKIKSSTILAIVFSLVCMITTGGRSMLFFLILTVVLAVYIKDRDFKKIVKNNKAALSICLVAVAVLLFVTLQRGFDDNSVLKSVYVYFVGCFNLFDVYLQSPELFFSHLLYGQALVSGATFPVVEALRWGFGLRILPGNYILANEALAKYINISPTVSINATPTTMYSAMRDFGFPGLIIYPAAICFCYQKIANWEKKDNSILGKAFLIYFLGNALLLSMAFQFGTFQILSVFLYLFIIYKISQLIIMKRSQKDEL